MTIFGGGRKRLALEFFIPRAGSLRGWMARMDGGRLRTYGARTAWGLHIWALVLLLPTLASHHIFLSLSAL